MRLVTQTNRIIKAWVSTGEKCDTVFPKGLISDDFSFPLQPFMTSTFRQKDGSVYAHIALTGDKVVESEEELLEYLNERTDNLFKAIS